MNGFSQHDDKEILSMDLLQDLIDFLVHAKLSREERKQTEEFCRKIYRSADGESLYTL